MIQQTPGEFDSYAQCLSTHCRRWENRVALRSKDYGIWNNYTWKDCYIKVKHLSLGLVSLGLRPGDKVAVIGDEKPEAFHSCLAIEAARGVAVPLYSEASYEEAAYIVNHSDSRFIIAEDQEQVDKILEIKGKLPLLQKAIYWDPKGMRLYDEPLLMSFEQLMALGRDYDREHPEAFEDNISHITGDDLCLLFYTSGTTGVPKGVMASHRAIISSGRSFCEYFNIKHGDDILNLVPAGSCFEHWFGGMHYLRGAMAHFCEEPETAVEDYREISPKVMFLSPTQWLSISSTLQMRVNDAGWLKRLVYNLFLPVGYRTARLRMSGVKPNLLWQALHLVGEWLLFRPMRDKIGLIDTEYPITGGFFTGPDVLMFFHAFGLRIGQVYGSTEAGMVACHGSHDINLDTVGPPCHGVTVRISEEGNILVRSDNICCGYFKDSTATSRTIKDGWLHTGDAGFINEDGHLVFVERAADLRQLSSGVRYAPAYIESRLKFKPFIQEAVVLGDESRDHLSVVITIDFQRVGKWAEKHKLSYTTFLDLSQKDEVAAIVRGDIAETNRTLPEPWRLRKYVILHKEFDADDAELTRSRKLRRGFIEDRYHGLVEAIYSGKEEFPIESEIKYRDGKTGRVSATLRIRSTEEK